MSPFSFICYFMCGGILYISFKEPFKKIYRKLYSKDKMRIKFNSLATYIHALNKDGKFDNRFTGKHKGYYFFKVENDAFLCARNPNGDYLYAIETTGNESYETKYVQWKVVNDEIFIPSYEDYYYIRKFDKNFRFIFDKNSAINN